MQEKQNEMKVTVITVVYNAVDTIERTIKSIISQTYQNIEYIIIDGGSTDGTIDVINKYREKISNFVSEKDAGIYDAMNKGIRAATGEIIALLNADDWYSSQNVIDSVVRTFKNTSAEIVYGDALMLNWRNSGNDYIFCENQPLEDMWWCMSIPHPATFVKKTVYDRVGIFDQNYKIAGDYEFILRCYSSNVVFKKIPEILVNFPDGGFSAKNLEINDIEALNVITKYYSMCPNKAIVRGKIHERISNLVFLKNKESSMLLRNLFDSAEKDDEIFTVIYGAGVWGKKAADICKNANINVLFFVDKSKTKQGISFNGCSVVAPEVLANFNGNVLIASKNYENEIEQEIMRLGNKNLKIIKTSQLLDFLNK